MDWYLNFNANTSSIPGVDKVLFIQMPTAQTVWNSGDAASIESLSDVEVSALGFRSGAQLESMAQAAPGSYWYVWGEANRYGYMTGARFAPVLHHHITHLMAGDPTAKIIGTSLLNWDFTCIGCGGAFACSAAPGLLRGYQCGRDWLDELINSYESTYNEKPPVYAWAIDTYPIDWTNTPNNDPSRLALYEADGTQELHSEIVIQQLVGMRAYLDSLTEYTATPIWITEIATHVAYDGWEWNAARGAFDPTGKYHWDKMAQYMKEILDWLDQNATSQNIEKWFFFTTWKNIVQPPASDPYMGIILFDEPEVGAPLNCLGQLYRARALALPPVGCDADGNVTP